MGLNFYDYDGLQPKTTPPKHISRQCIWASIFLIWNYVLFPQMFSWYELMHTFPQIYSWYEIMYIFPCNCIDKFSNLSPIFMLTQNVEKLYIVCRHVAKSKNLGGHVVMRRAAARRRLLIRQNLGEQLPPLPPPFQHGCEA